MEYSISLIFTCCCTDGGATETEALDEPGSQFSTLFSAKSRSFSAAICLPGYVDDLPVTADLEQKRRQVLKILKGHHFIINQAKTEYHQSRLRILGHWIQHKLDRDMERALDHGIDLRTAIFEVERLYMVN